VFNETRYGERNGRILAEVVAEINEELKGFPRDRAQMLISELRESVKNSKSAALWGRPAASRNGMAVAQPRASWTGCHGFSGHQSTQLSLRGETEHAAHNRPKQADN